MAVSAGLTRTSDPKRQARRESVGLRLAPGRPFPYGEGVLCSLLPERPRTKGLTGYAGEITSITGSRDVGARGYPALAGGPPWAARGRGELCNPAASCPYCCTVPCLATSCSRPLGFAV